MSAPAVAGPPATQRGAAVHAEGHRHGAHGTLSVRRARALDDKSFVLTFSDPLSAQIREFVDGNAEYLTEYLHVDGGSAAGDDAALDGAALSGVAGTRVYTVDGDRASLRVVLGSGATLRDATYRVWLDGDGLSLSDDLLIKGADGEEFRGEQSATERLRGTSADADPAQIAAARATDRRSVRLTFDDPVLDGMPAGRYDGDGITVEGDGSTASPTYVQRLDGTDSRAWELVFADDLPRHASITIEGDAHGLRTSAGTLGDDDVLSTTVRGRGHERRSPRVTSVDVAGDGESIAITFDRKISTFTHDDGVEELAETALGTGGSTLDRDVLLDGVSLDGDVVGGGRHDLDQNLEQVAAYVPDLRTIVVKVEGGEALQPRSRGSVTIEPGTLTDLAGVSNTRLRASFRVPRAAKPSSSYDASAEDFLAVDDDASVSFQRNAFEFTDPEGGDFSVRPENVENRLVEDTADAIVVENKYVEATFVPGYGGRMLSLIYKPTGNDLLYTNPVGTPYGFTSTPVGRPGNSPFYHNWLMVWGGVFPTITEAEHGKYWFLPWDYDIEESDDAIAITMTRTDDLNYADRPSKYRYGATGLETSVTYTVDKTSPAVDMSVSIHNPNDVAKQFEYWTCTTLAPGASSHEGSPTMEIVSPVSVIQRESWYPWIDDVEEPANPATPGDNYKVLDQLKKMVNWDRDGIVYGQGLADNPQGNWWGVINQENGEGVVRIGENDKTPGMKFWEWGYENSFDTNIYDNGHSARPYIELWAGRSNKFFQPATIAAGDTIAWTETYQPTMDLANVTNANGDGAAQVAFSGSGDDVTVRGDVFSTRIGEELTVRLVDDASGDVLAERSFVASAEESADLSAEASAGETVRLELVDGTGEVLLTAVASQG
ncbi:DUF5107 domain-containing protein [Mumia flava]|uniref:DUF5107 domain-containing protein n=1 Tax=Mumia flava TaxID=1348852 RepID=UPI000C24365D|nr:DUF5107 domain-containing protein [Mumia flava]